MILSTTLVFLFIVFSLAEVYFFRKKPTPKDVTLPSFAIEENLNEPIFSYSVYTVDAVLNHRYLNYTHKDFPNHVGILKGQYLEIEWNIINADLITISGVGLVKAVGRKAFYPTENITYTITAKNKEYEMAQTIYVRVFPISVSDNLFTKIPKVRIQSQQIKQTPELTKLPMELLVMKPTMAIEKPTFESLNNVLQNKIVTKNFTKKIKDYISTNQPTKKNQDGRI